jgi:phage shock protein C
MSTEGTGGSKRLYRSRTDRIVGGVCGGFAEYLEIDPTVIRLLWIISMLIFGFGLLLYIIALFIIPNNPFQQSPKTSDTPAQGEQSPPVSPHHSDWNLVIGIVLLILGVLFLLGQFDVFGYHWVRFYFFPWRLFWPLLIIGAGIYFIVSGTTIHDAVNGVRRRAASSKLRKSRTDKMLFGVCGGLGKSFDIDPTVVRILWAIGSLLSGGVFFLIYIVLAVIMPFEDEYAKAPDNHNNATGSTGR